MADPKGEFLTFEASNEKTGGGKGRADVWENDFIRLLFCLFTEDIELLPKDLFS